MTADRDKAIKRLMEIWKKSPGIMQKALHVIHMNEARKSGKRRSFLIP
jgi:hypothetical protein